jgi:nucleotide sugar dehydrogenase
MTSASIVGLGYVGFPVLIEALKHGIRVLGIDNSPENLKQRQAELRDLADVGQWVLTSDASQITTTDYVVICVPTPLDAEGNPDYRHVLDVCQVVGPFLSKGQTVILESTVGPGTTTGVVRQTLEKFSGLEAGSDFHLAFSPERIDPNNQHFFLANTPKVVGALTQECLEKALAFYSEIVQEVVPASGLLEAETAKLLENMYRHVNISFINEFSNACSVAGINFREVIRLASTKPFGFQVFLPGPGAGGHCVPVDPNYFQQFLRDKGIPPLKTIQLANLINEKQPLVIANRVNEVWNALETQGARPLVLGLSYKANVGDFRESKQLQVLRSLMRMGHNPKFHDFYLTHGTRGNQDLPNDDSGWVSDEALFFEIEQTPLIILLQSHQKYSEDYLANYGYKILNCTGQVIPGARWSM